MTTQAISSYGTEVRIGDAVALSPIAITGATNASPIVLTTAAHGITDVTWVTVAGVGGNTAANGTWIAARVDATHLTLRGSTGNGVYTSGGTVTPSETFTTIAELTNVQDAGLMATLIETSAHDGNGYASRIPTFLSGNALRLEINLVPANVTHAAHWVNLLARVARNWLVVWPDAAKTTWKFTGFVVQDRSQAPVAGALTASIVIEIDGAPVLAAA